MEKWRIGAYAAQLGGTPKWSLKLKANLICLTSQCVPSKSTNIDQLCTILKRLCLKANTHKIKFKYKKPVHWGWMEKDKTEGPTRKALSKWRHARVQTCQRSRLLCKQESTIGTASQNGVLNAEMLVAYAPLIAHGWPGLLGPMETLTWSIIALLAQVYLS